MATKNKTRLTLHGLLGALSFWGTSVRLLLMAFLAGAVLAARVIVDPGLYDTEILVFIYIVGSFALLDAGYVMIARALQFEKVADMTVLLTAEALIGLAYVVPNFAYVPVLASLSRWTILTVLFILSVRVLLGLLFPVTKKR